MLDLAAIKSTSQVADAQAQNGKKPANRAPGEDPAQEFEAEYEATSQRAEETKAEPGDKGADAADADSAVRETEEEEAAAAAPEDPELEQDVPKDEPTDVLAAFDPEETAPLAIAGEVRTTETPAAGAATSAVPTFTDQEAQADRETDMLKTAGTKAAIDAEPALNRREPAGKTTAESIIMSKAVENAGKAVSGREQGPQPADAGPASPEVQEGQVASKSPV